MTMEKYEAYGKARADREQSEIVLSLIGKDQPHTTAKAKGVIHNLNVSLSVHFQERDGAKNYHEHKALNAALSVAALKNWHILSQAAQEILRLEERDRLIDCESEISRIQRQIQDAKS